LNPAGGADALGLQIAILKVLASYPDGRATIAEMKNDLAILGGAGVAWSQRLKALAARAPSLDIFSEGFVIRDSDGWQLTPAGRKALHRIEHPAPAIAATPRLEAITRPTPASAPRARAVVQLVGRNERPYVAMERSAGRPLPDHAARLIGAIQSGREVPQPR
jgi:hypothetical protein